VWQENCYSRGRQSVFARGIDLFVNFKEIFRGASSHYQLPLGSNYHCAQLDDYATDSKVQVA